MKSILILSLFFISTLAAYNQTLPDNFCDSTYKVALRTRNETVRISCDSVYLMNKITFRLLFNSYINYHQQSTGMAEFFSTKDTFIDTYKMQIELERRHYDSLNHYFVSLRDSTNFIITRTQGQLQSVSASLDSIKSELTAARINVGNAIIATRRERQKQFLIRLGWGTAGNAAGGLITALILK